MNADISYVAGRRLKMSDGSYREIGNEVPEAAEWLNLRAWINTGHIIVLGAQGAVSTLREKPIPKPPKRVVNVGRERGAMPPAPTVHVGSDRCGVALKSGMCLRKTRHGGPHSAKTAKQRASERAQRKSRRPRASAK